MQMVIHNPNNLPTIDYREVKPLQGNLKDLSKVNFDKLKNVLENRGFKVPLFLWKDGSTYYLMDGHQRQRVMIETNANDNGDYKVPFVLIEADGIDEAKAQLLEVTSQYGKITQEGFDEFIAGIDMPEVDLMKNISFDALPLVSKTQVPPADASGSDEQQQGGGTSDKYRVSVVFENVGDYELFLEELNPLAESYNGKVYEQKKG